MNTRRRVTRYQELVAFRAEAGTNEKIEKVAENRGVYPADYLRGALKTQLDVDAKKEA